MNVPFAERIFYVYVARVIASLGIVGNLLSLLTLRRKSLSESPYTFLTALALADVVVLGLMIGVGVVRCGNCQLNITQLYVGTIYEQYFYLPFINMAHHTSTFITVFMTLERYIFVRDPLYGKVLCTRGKARTAVFAAAIFAIALNTPRFFMVTLGDNSSVGDMLFPVPLRPTYLVMECSLPMPFFDPKAEYHSSIVVPRCILSQVQNSSGASLATLMDDRIRAGEVYSIDSLETLQDLVGSTLIPVHNVRIGRCRKGDYESNGDQEPDENAEGYYDDGFGNDDEFVSFANWTSKEELERRRAKGFTIEPLRFFVAKNFSWEYVFTKMAAEATSALPSSSPEDKVDMSSPSKKTEIPVPRSSGLLTVRTRRLLRIVKILMAISKVSTKNQRTDFQLKFRTIRQLMTTLTTLETQKFTPYTNIPKIPQNFQKSRALSAQKFAKILKNPEQFSLGGKTKILPKKPHLKAKSSYNFSSEKIFLEKTMQKAISSAHLRISSMPVSTILSRTPNLSGTLETLTARPQKISWQKPLTIGRLERMSPFSQPTPSSLTTYIPENQLRIIVNITSEEVLLPIFNKLPCLSPRNGTRKNATVIPATSPILVIRTPFYKLSYRILNYTIIIVEIFCTIVMALLNLGLIKILRQNLYDRRVDKRSNMSLPNLSKNAQHDQQRLTITLIVITAFTVMSTILSMLTSDPIAKGLFGDEFQDHETNKIVTLFNNFISLINNSVNFVFYSLFNTRFRRELQMAVAAIIPCCRGNKRSHRNRMSTNSSIRTLNSTNSLMTLCVKDLPATMTNIDCSSSDNNMSDVQL